MTIYRGAVAGIRTRAANLASSHNDQTILRLLLSDTVKWGIIVFSVLFCCIVCIEPHTV